MRSAPPLLVRERGLGGEGCAVITRLCNTPCPPGDNRVAAPYPPTGILGGAVRQSTSTSSGVSP